jgi:site-specific recombinase XerD
MEQSIRQTVSELGKWLEGGGYGKGTLVQYKSTTNQLLKYMDSEGIREYTTAVGLEFMRKQYALTPETPLEHSNLERLRCLQRITEFQLHGAPLLRTRKRTYEIPAAFREATDGFVAYRRFEGIIERNICAISLYLERFFQYLTAQSVTRLPQIEARHIHGYLRFIMGFTAQSRDHMMRTVRQYLGFCYKNGYHPEDLSPFVPLVHYDKRARIPSAYSHDDVLKLLSTVDRANPVGKRNYAILLLIARLGLRSGDVANLKYENINWGENRISLTQHKTGRPLTLPLLEDVGLGIIDYLKFGRPKCETSHVFLRHRPPIDSFSANGIYSLVSSYISKAGLLTQGKKHGPHALRHSLASRLLEENVPLPVISAILGHADTNTTAVYLSVDIEKLRGCALEV